MVTRLRQTVTLVIDLLSLSTVAAFVGVALLIAGLHMIYQPLALIVPGAVLLAGAVYGVVRNHGKADG